MQNETIKRIAATLPGENDMLAIIGPTASGKTAFATRLAKQLIDNGIPTEIISGDSRQIYRGMDIGTGKDISEYTVDGMNIPYHLIDIADAGEKYNLFRYCTAFKEAYSSIRERGAFPILCGGSGLYVEAVTKGYTIPEVEPDPELREKLEKLEMEELVRILSSMKKLHNTTDIDTKKRAVRAIEIATYYEKHGIDPYSKDLCEGLPQNVRFIGISVDRDERNRRIDARLDARLEEGMVNEVKSLLDKGISAEDLIYYGLEYKFVTKYIIGEFTYEQMREGLAIAIHQFAKRQMTWFRGMERRGLTIEWMENPL